MKYFLFFSSLFLFVSCSNNDLDTQREELIGTWVLLPDALGPDSSHLITYQFFENGSLEALNAVKGPEQDQILGYRYRALGTFLVQENLLIIKRNEIYINDDESRDFSDLDGLEPIGGSEAQTFEFFFDENKQILTFDYGPCNDTRNCIGSQTFLRME